MIGIRRIFIQFYCEFAKVAGTPGLMKSFHGNGRKTAAPVRSQRNVFTLSARITETFYATDEVIQSLRCLFCCAKIDDLCGENGLINQNEAGQKHLGPECRLSGVKTLLQTKHTPSDCE